MSTTKENLQTAFAGESQASQKYLAFARKAEDEGYPQAAKLFRAAAAAERIHAANHLRAMAGIGSTAENLQAAISGESYEITNMYPPFIAAAEADGEKRALNSLKWAWEVEKIHEGLYRKVLAALETEGKAGVDYTVCPVCGYTHEGPAPEKCPVCGTPGTRFEWVR